MMCPLPPPAFLNSHPRLPQLTVSLSDSVTLSKITHNLLKGAEEGASIPLYAPFHTHGAARQLYIHMPTCCPHIPLQD